MAKAPLKYKNIAKLNEKLNILHIQTNQALNAGLYDKALELALTAHKMVPATPAPLDRAGLVCLKAKRYEEAVKFAQKALSRDPNYLNSYNILSEAYYLLGEMDKCRENGLFALQLTEKTISNQELPSLPLLDFTGRTKKIIAFSLFGNQPVYLESAVLNSQVAHSLYPDWICRFYVDDSVPASVIARLQAEGAEIVFMPDTETMPKTMWRFLAGDDSQASHILFRDADSVISVQEAKLVQAWLESGKRFHTIRDYGSHTELILAGLWGMVGGSIPNITEKIREFVTQGGLHQRFADQHFLRQVIWNYVKQDNYALDSVFGFGEDVHFFQNVYKASFHIGCREAVTSFEVTNPEWQEGDTIVWQLFTRRSAELNEDLTPVSLRDETLICTYEQKVKNGKISDYLPNRYAKGLKDGSSRIASYRKIA